MAYMTGDGAIHQYTGKTDRLNGLRVRIKDEGKTGHILGAYIDSIRRVAHIGVQMDEGGSRWGFHPYDLELIQPMIEESGKPLLSLF